LGCGDNDLDRSDDETDDTNDTKAAKQTIHARTYAVRKLTPIAHHDRL